MDPIQMLPVRPAPPSRREAAADARRRRQLRRLARDVWDLRPAIAYVQHELQRLVARAQVLPLSREEAARASVLQRERAALRHRLRVYATEYERLRPGPAPPWRSGGPDA